ncbi:hypothetical protein L6Q21_06710 [Sandaracinobacter sp. RS1-74]|uniref:alpha/beta hydrolase n=1 Tax=Sandaracinobacteroides sayramensis TaxID=2913411 RepID=UPI001EDB5B4B|nr:alpha/beta hydrolase-fold protein [Sandaracinobacteroides sayramensis]MCG2840665.1 hypothetical protein [Sandaracinobacteroides sayramensis]
MKADPRFQLTERRAIHDGYAYHISLCLPDGPAPVNGWPALLLLDADGCFATATEALQRMARRPDATAVEPMVLIGIAHAGDDNKARRETDFTDFVPTEGEEGSRGGSGRHFLEFLRREVIQSVPAPLDGGRLALFGHSLGGYFTLWALTHGGYGFSRFIAVSPSIWWDSEQLQPAGIAVGGSSRVLLLAGEWEGPLPPWQAALENADSVRKRRSQRNMIEAARELGMQLQSQLGDGGAAFHLLPGEDHASIVSAAIPRALRLAST